MSPKKFRSTAVTAATAALWIQSAAGTGVMQKSEETASGHGTTTKIQVYVCQNTAPGAGQDQGCPPHQPICVDAQQQSPAHKNAKGINCVPCISQFDTPMEPDWGCSPQKPLCGTSSEPLQRTETGTAGTQCIDYPCRNTHDDDGEKIDQGCTDDHPSCVDALGNDPPTGQPGVACVISKHQQVRSRSLPDTTTQFQKSQVATAAWGVIESSLKSSTSGKTSKTGTAKCLILAGEVEPLPWNKSGQLPLCNGCPFGISKECEIGAKQQKLTW